MQIEISPLGDRLVAITLSGRMDTQGVDGVETRFIAAVVPAGNSAIVDLSQVDFIASMGIRMLLSAARSLRMRQAKVAIYGPMAQVAEVLDTVALHQVIPICSTRAEALAAVAVTPA